MMDFYDFFMNEKPLQIEIPEIIKIYMRNFYCKLSFDIATGDALNGYGMRVSPWITLYRYGEKCQKCGYSTLYTATMHKECWGNHRWGKDYCSLWGTDLTNVTAKKLADEFEHFLIHSTERIAGHKDFVNSYISKNKGEA
jgi:hypothetical protein